jgi:hypothetical protein
MIPQPRPWIVIAACAGLTMSLWAQAPADAPQLKILSPDEETYITGVTLLRAGVTPPDSVSGLTFFVDGRQVCALTQLPFECEWDAGATIAAHQVRAVATVKGGARIVQTVRTKSIGYVERVDVDVVQVTVTVADGHGKFVRNIPKSAFRVFEDGRPQVVTHFASEDVPLELVAAIDISGSMGPVMPKVKKAVKEFLGDVPPRDQVTLLGFNDTILTLTRKTTDLAERIKAVDRRRSTTCCCAGSRSSAGSRDARRWSCSPTARIKGATRRSTTSSAACSPATSRST